MSGNFNLKGARMSSGTARSRKCTVLNRIEFKSDERICSGTAGNSKCRVLNTNLGGCGLGQLGAGNAQFLKRIQLKSNADAVWDC